MHAEVLSTPRPPHDATAGDAELAAAIRRGERGAIERLVRRHNRLLYRTARAILRDDAEAEEAVQDAYVHALRGLESFRGDSALSTWLVRIVANEALMRRRRGARRAAVIPLVDADAATLENVRDEDAGPEARAASAELRSLLERRIDALPDLYRTVFVLRAVEDMSVEETARALELPEATVRTRFFRARALMRAALEQDFDAATVSAFAFDGARCDRIVREVLARLAQP